MGSVPSPSTSKTSGTRPAHTALASQPSQSTLTFIGRPPCHVAVAMVGDTAATAGDTADPGGPDSLRWSQETTRTGSTMYATRLRAVRSTYPATASLGTPTVRVPTSVPT